MRQVKIPQCETIFHQLFCFQTLPTWIELAGLNKNSVHTLHGHVQAQREKTTFPSENFISRLENVIFPFSIRGAAGVHACRQSIHF